SNLEMQHSPKIFCNFCQKTLAKNNGTIYIEGNSTYTITVDSYENTADMSGAPKTDEWSSYEVERSENL
uniref:hypothetical protein n=1 Tax=Roseburia hominis TaxID=301301 RepID=UPI00403846B7